MKMRQRFIDNKYVDFRDVDAIAKGQNKSLRQAFIEMEEGKERMARGNSSLIKDYQKNTQFFHDSNFFADSEASQFPIDAFQSPDFNGTFTIKQSICTRNRFLSYRWWCS